MDAFSSTSCAGSKKVDFEKAYKFSTYRCQKAPKDERAKPDTVEYLPLSASIAHKEYTEQQGSLLQFEEFLVGRIGLDPGATMKIDKKQIQEMVSEMSAGEIRQLRKEVKSELKKLRVEATWVLMQRRTSR